jgi:hypothetical protein
VQFVIEVLEKFAASTFRVNAVKMKTAGFSETSIVPFYRTARCHVRRDSNIGSRAIPV